MADNLYKKISNVMAKIEYIKKDDTVSTGNGGGYKALSEEKVTELVRKALVNEGLVILPVEQATSRDTFQVEKEFNGKVTHSQNHLTTVEVKYKIVNIDDPTQHEILASSGTGVDTQDKGIGKAMTYAYKYMLLRTFAIPSGDDPDKISSDVYTNQITGEVTAPPKPQLKPYNPPVKQPDGVLKGSLVCPECGAIGKPSAYNVKQAWCPKCKEAGKTTKWDIPS